MESAAENKIIKSFFLVYSPPTATVPKNLGSELFNTKDLGRSRSNVAFD
jgi:hypothetical protein